MAKHISKESRDIINEKIDEFKKLFPETLSESKIDFDKLKLTLGEEVNGKDEKYSFNWAGRKESFKNIQTTAKGTLIPVKDESINWDSTENLFIEGDNLEVLKLLQKAYFNKIKMIYIDPPYNTGKDFVYKDNFHNSIKAYLEQTGQSNGDGIKLTTNPETSGRFHSDWISMMYPRLFVARNFLSENGAIFVSINDKEVHNLKMLLNDIFGEENFVAQLVWENREGGGGSDSTNFKIKHEYILVYAKDVDTLEINGLKIDNEDRYTEEDEFVNERGKYLLIKLNSASIQYSSSLDYPIKSPDGTDINPSYGSKRACWRWSKKKFEWGVKNKFIVIKKDKNGEWAVYTKQYLKVDNEGNPIDRTKRPMGVIPNYSSTQATKRLEELFKGKIFDYSKPYQLIEYLISLIIEENDTLLDFFAGSGTTAEAVTQYNHKHKTFIRFVLIQLPEKIIDEKISKEYATICDIAKERIIRAIKDLKEDVGFKVFKLEKSNYKIWEKYEGKDEEELKKQLELFKSPLISGYKEINVIYECIVKEGYSLNSKIEKIDSKTNKVYKVTDGEIFFHICLDQDIKDNTIDELKLKKDNLFICLDEALNDSKKKNLSIQCNLKII